MRSFLHSVPLRSHKFNSPTTYKGIHSFSKLFLAICLAQGHSTSELLSPDEWLLQANYILVVCAQPHILFATIILGP